MSITQAAVIHFILFLGNITVQLSKITEWNLINFYLTIMLLIKN